MTAEQEVDALKSQAEYFKDALDEISKRIEELESKQTDKK
jgi:predicted  nucleic acid-binding Zn-ribbon protein